jgi:hypothetical protein
MRSTGLHCAYQLGLPGSRSQRVLLRRSNLQTWWRSFQEARPRISAQTTIPERLSAA